MTGVFHHQTHISKQTMDCLICFKLPGAEGHVGNVPQNFETVDETTFAFDKEQFDSFPDNVNVDGYRQTEKYFKHIENKIRKDFAFLPEIMKPCRKFM